jgi:hypothetical protein
MSLAGFAAPDELWAGFEIKWNKILKDHVPKADYVHVNEINALSKAFDEKLGWNHLNAFGLAGKWLGLHEPFRQRAFSDVLLHC